MKSGYVAIIGRPNVGKSTLLNYLIGEKLAGVSPKPQTTRKAVHGILTEERGQVVFLDTPGMHDAHDLLSGWMMREIEKSLADADLLYWLVLPEMPRSYEEKILKLIEKLKIPIFLVVNQIDRFEKPAMLPVLEHYNKKFAFKELIPISAKKGKLVDVLLEKTFENLPEGPAYFPEDQISDQNERFIASEMIREKIFRSLKQELPYSIAVEIESFKARTEKLTDIEATILVERDSQKSIVIGKGGEMLRKIGQSARIDLEKFLGQKVYLQLWVKVLPQWKKDKAALRRLGFE